MIFIQILLVYLLFFLAIYVSFYIPGRYILSFLGKDIDAKAHSVLSWPLGYSCFILLSYTGAWVHVAYLPLIFILGIFSLVIITRRNLFKMSLSNMPRAVLFLIFFGSLAFTGMSFLSGLTTSHGFQMIGNDNGTDAIMHVARIKTQVFLFPPVYTGFYGFVMRGYHYFYDFLLSRFVLFYHFSAEDLYYRLFPFAISLMYGAIIYVFSNLYTKRNIDKLLILFFAYFGTSFAYLLSFFTRSVDAGNGMGLVQQLGLILDPSIIFSTSIMLAGFYFVLLKKKTIVHAILAGFIIGLLMQLKIYAGIIALGSLVIFSGYLLKKYAAWKYVLYVNSIAILLTCITYGPNNFGVGRLLFSPFFLYGNFMKQALFSSWNWEMRIFIYTAHHNIPRLIFMFGSAFLLFWILALGTRIAFVLQAKSILKRNFWNEQNFLLCAAIIIPFVLASIFVQSISIFDTVQFLWMVAILISIPAGIFYGKIFSKLPLSGKLFLTILLVFFSFGELITNETAFVFHPQPVVVSPAKLHLLKIVQQTVPKKGYFVTAPSYVVDKYGKRNFVPYPAPLFSALTGRRTYYEYEIPIFPDERKVAYRKQQLENITLFVEKCDGDRVASIMRHTGTPYLITLTNLSCKTIGHMKKIQTVGDWTFWIVK